MKHSWDIISFSRNIFTLRNEIFFFNFYDSPLSLIFSYVAAGDKKKKKKGPAGEPRARHRSGMLSEEI